MADYRIVWMRDRITKALGVQDHPEALETLMKENHEKFQALMDDEVSDVSEMEKCILYIYRTFYDRLVEREVVTIEKGKFTIELFVHKIFFFTQHSFLWFYVVPRIMTPPPPPVASIEFQKKGKKGKGKKDIQYFSSRFFLPRNQRLKMNRNFDL